MLIVPNQRVASDVFCIDRRDLVKHLRKVQVEPGVCLDEYFKLFQLRRQCLALVVGGSFGDAPPRLIVFVVVFRCECTGTAVNVN